MAKYRAIQIKFWTDPWISELTPEQKYFYICYGNERNVMADVLLKRYDLFILNGMKTFMSNSYNVDDIYI